MSDDATSWTSWREFDGSEPPRMRDSVLRYVACIIRYNILTNCISVVRNIHFTKRASDNKLRGTFVGKQMTGTNCLGNTCWDKRGGGVMEHKRSENVSQFLFPQTQVSASCFQRTCSPNSFQQIYDVFEMCSPSSFVA